MFLSHFESDAALEQHRLLFYDFEVFQNCFFWKKQPVENRSKSNKFVEKLENVIFDP